MDSLIAIGSAAAMIYGVVAIYMIGWGLGHGDTALVEQYSMDLYFESAGMILALITLGKFLETRSRCVSETGSWPAKARRLPEKDGKAKRPASSRAFVFALSEESAQRL